MSMPDRENRIKRPGKWPCHRCHGLLVNSIVLCFRCLVLMYAFGFGCHSTDLYDVVVIGSNESDIYLYGLLFC